MALGLSRTKAAKAVPAEPAEVVLRPDEIVGIAVSIELIPVPLALVGAPDGPVVLAAANRAFRVAGLGSAGHESPMIALLGERIAAFLAGDAANEEFAWEFGDAVDCRYFRVTLARRSPASSYCFATLVDHTGELRTARNLRREMITDSLTGLPNRSGFSELLEERIAEGGGARFAVLIIDLDRFSRVNACLGSMAGDELLITLARRLKGALRASDMLARTGGDEFGILLALEESEAEAEQVVRRIQETLATPFRMSDFEIRVSCSIGIAFGSDMVEDSEDLIRHAHFAVKRSKTSGQAEYYQTQALDMAREQFGIETELRRAIENGAMRLTYHPICDLATGKVVAFESLARWTDEHGHEHSPADFIPVAEESGLIVPLGRWAIDEAARTLRSWDVRAGGGDRPRGRGRVEARGIDEVRDHLDRSRLGDREVLPGRAGQPGGRCRDGVARQDRKARERQEAGVVSDEGDVGPVQGGDDGGRVAVGRQDLPGQVRADGVRDRVVGVNDVEPLAAADVHDRGGEAQRVGAVLELG